MEQILLENVNMYGPYKGFMDHDLLIVRTSTFTRDTLDIHFECVMNILRDGIETDEVQNIFITVIFCDEVDIQLSIFDYYFNLIMWQLPCSLNIPITSKYLFFEDALTRKGIKKYIDMFIYDNIEKYPFNELNRVISDTLEKFSLVDEFSMWLCNTINLEDTIDLMKEYTEFNASMHLDLSGVPIEDVKAKGMEAANLQIDYIKNSNHCLKDNFLTGEGVNAKQYKEVFSHIGSKPDGHGGIFPSIINTSYVNGGLYETEALYIDSSVARVAQILSKINVADSGNFARLLGINNIDTIFHPLSNYVCDTKNFLEVTIDDQTQLSLFNDRYYKDNEFGPDKLLNARKDKHLIGKKLLFRSPTTCASFARGEGICPRCYGRLYWVNRDINPGKMAAELLSSKFTQRQLSAKHLLESAVIKMLWPELFYELFEVNFNAITLIEDYDYSGYKLIIDPNNIYLEDEEEDVSYNEYITNFDIQFPDGSIHSFHTAELDSIYISMDLNNAIRFTSAPVDGMITLDLDQLTSTDCLFLMHIKNNELSKTLETTKAIINKDAVTSQFDRNSIVKEFTLNCKKGGIDIQAIHAEVMIANQIRQAGEELEDILEKPDWTVPNAPYRILTLNSSLNNNPSIAVTLQYQKVGKTFYNPLSFKKHKASFLDLYFMEQPQLYFSNQSILADETNIKSDIEVNLEEGLIFDNGDNGEPEECSGLYDNF